MPEIPRRRSILNFSLFLLLHVNLTTPTRERVCTTINHFVRKCHANRTDAAYNLYRHNSLNFRRLNGIRETSFTKSRVLANLPIARGFGKQIAFDAKNDINASCLSAYPSMECI
jgi:hypothetical protein